MDNFWIARGSARAEEPSSQDTRTKKLCRLSR
jgi:hypothetical protein